MPMYVVELNYLIGIEADSSIEAERCAIQLVEDGQYDPNDIHISLWKYEKKENKNGNKNET